MVVVIDHVRQCGKTAVVIKAPLLMGPQALERRRPVPSVGRAIGLKVVDADFSRGMHIPTWFGENRRDMAGCAFRFSVEYRLSVLHARRHTTRVRRCGYREVIKMH